MLFSKFILLVIFACYLPANSIATSDINPVSKKTLSTSFSHTFSDLHKKDLFQISIYGKTLTSGQVVFEIFNYKHQQIFKTKFLTNDLLGDEEDLLLTDKQKGAKIKQRIKGFFASTNFLFPAINSNEKFDAGNYDHEMWNEIKSDPSIIGFGYQYGYEGYYRIAYSKRKKCVMQYFYSD